MDNKQSIDSTKLDEILEGMRITTTVRGWDDGRRMLDAQFAQRDARIAEQTKRIEQLQKQLKHDICRATESQLRARIAELEARQGGGEPVVWLPVVGYEGLYSVSNAGDLRNDATGKILAKNLAGAGYVKADLYANKIRKQTVMHRVVALAFLGPAEGREVNHKNGIKTDNRVANLEWVSRSDNVNHSYYGLGNIVTPLLATSVATGEKIEYPSLAAAVADGFNESSIYRCLKGTSKSHRGYEWEYFTAPPETPARAAVERAKLHEMHSDEGDIGWYFDCDGHYIDVERDKDGKYSVYFRNRADQSEAWLDQADGPAAPTQGAQGDVPCDCCADIRAAEAIYGDGPGAAQQEAVRAVPDGLMFDGYCDSDEYAGKTILDFFRSRLEDNADEMAVGDLFYLDAVWAQPQQWRIVCMNPFEVERIAAGAHQASAKSEGSAS